MAEPSGPQWCGRFPASQSLDDLLPDFGDKVRAFLSRLQKAGATVTIADTYRPPERAYLMHWCCMVGGSGQDPEAVSPMDGVNIDWGHGGAVPVARDAAQQMMTGYDIQFPAALESRHTQRRAVDMTISWNGTLAITDFNGQSHATGLTTATSSAVLLASGGVASSLMDFPVHNAPCRPHAVATDPTFLALLDVFYNGPRRQPRDFLRGVFDMVQPPRQHFHRRIGMHAGHAVALRRRHGGLIRAIGF
jgi:hypothetical protein